MVSTTSVRWLVAILFVLAGTSAPANDSRAENVDSSAKPVRVACAGDNFPCGGGVEEAYDLAAETQHAGLSDRLQRQLTAGWRGTLGEASSFLTTTAVDLPAGPAVSTGFESVPAGPFLTIQDSSGTWEAAAGHAAIQDQHFRSGRQSLWLVGGKERQVVWLPVVSTQTPDHLSFWFERWTRAQPWEFRVEALIGNTWRLLHDDKTDAVVGPFRNRLALKIPRGETPSRFRFTNTAPLKAGVMIDDVRLGQGNVIDPVPVVAHTREVEGRRAVDLFYDGLNGAANYRIPSLIVTPKGTVLAVCDRRIDRPGDAPNNIDQVVRPQQRSWQVVERYGHDC